MSGVSELKARADETLFPPKFELVNNIPAGTLTEEARIHRDLVANAYRAMLEGNEGALAEIMHPDVHFREAAGLPYGVEAKGLEAALKGVTGMFDAWSSVHCELIEVLGGGDLAIAYMTLTNVSRATGKTYTGPVCEVFRFKDGKVIEWHPVYWDTHAVRQACGLAD